MSEPVADPDQHASLTAPDAGDRAIRGGVVRVAGYGAGLLLTAIASIFLLRYLGVDRFGQYTTVVAIVTVVQGVTDGGLGVVGQRRYVHTSSEKRAELLGNLVGMRLVLTPLGIACGVLFAVVAGYPNALVTGTLLAGLGVVLAVVAATLAMPLAAELRLGAVTAVDFARQLVIVVGICVLVVAGAGLLPFFATYIAAGAAALAVAFAFVGPGGRARPRFAWGEWKPILREAAPVAMSVVVNTTYVRALIILCSLLATAEQTGLFATSYRVSEILLGVPQMMISAAFPIIAHAHVADEERLAYALQRMGEAAMLAGVGCALVLVVGASPIIDLLGGSEYAAAAETLRLQSVAIAGAFMTQMGTFALIAIERQRALVVVNALALVIVVALGFTLIPLWEANGAAVAASIGEVVLAVAALTLLARARPSLRPDLRYVPKVLLAAGVAACSTLLPIPDVVATVMAVAVYAGLVFLLRVVPMELVDALLRRKPADTAT